MTKIVVCFKIVPDYEDIPVSDWQSGQVPDVTFAPKMYNCFDEAALEMALGLKDDMTAAGLETECVAVTLGGGQAALLSGLYAAGFDRVVCITENCAKETPRDAARQTTEPLALSPRDTACQLAEFLKAEQADIIFTGRQAGGEDSGTVPAYLGAGLSLPWLPEVIRVRIAGENPLLLTVDCEGTAAVDTFLAAGPVLLSVGNAEKSYLRMFSLKARLEARKKDVRLWKAPKISARERHITYFSEKKEHACTMLEGTTEEITGHLRKLVREACSQ